MPTALITGITGQDGAYLAQLLLEKGYRVVGLLRRSASADVVGNKLRWLGVYDDVEMKDGDLRDLSSLIRIVQQAMPDEVYNLAAQASSRRPGSSLCSPAKLPGWEQPACLRHCASYSLAHASIRHRRRKCSGVSRKPVKVNVRRFTPRSPYAVAKLFAHWITVNYRESFGFHASSGILFNHESPLRGIEFVTRRITDGVARIKLGLATELTLGNLDAQRDWGHARDYVRAMWLMLQQDEADDYVIATGRTTSVRGFCELAFGHVGLGLQRLRRFPKRAQTSGGCGCPAG